MSADQNFYLKNYECFRLDRNSRGGGLTVFISSKFCHRAKIAYKAMSSDYEVLVVQLNLPGCAPLSIVNNYFPAGIHDESALDVTLSFCKKNILFAGDFNSHHVSWGFRTDTSGKWLWDWTNNFICLNSKVATFVRCTSRSVLDLTFASSNVLISSWTVLDTATSSDHRPLVFEVKIPVLSVDYQAQNVCKLLQI